MSTTTMTATERLARAALELHRLAMTASELSGLPSPRAPRERNAKGAADPTPNTVMDPRRVAVAEALSAADRLAATLAEVDVAAIAHTLAAALNQWDGK